MTPDLQIYLSHIKLNIYCPVPEVIPGLKAVWGGACTPQIATELEYSMTITPDAPYRLYGGEELLAEFESLTTLLPGVEVSIYDLLYQWHQRYTVLHGALVQNDVHTLLMVGPSGAGKSSLALEALKLGWHYRTDEIVVTEGSQMWGINRAVQFNPMPVSKQLPQFLVDADISSYRWLSPDLGEVYQPLYKVPANTRQNPTLDEVTLVVLNPDAAAGVTELEGISALACLHEACFNPPQHNLGPLTQNAWMLGWTNRSKAFRSLQDLPGRRAA